MNSRDFFFLISFPLSKHSFVSSLGLENRRLSWNNFLPAVKLLGNSPLLSVSKTHEVEAELSTVNVLLKIYLVIKTCLSLSETVKYKAPSENDRILTNSASQTKDSAECPTWDTMHCWLKEKIQLSISMCKWWGLGNDSRILFGEDSRNKGFEVQADGADHWF